MNATSYVALGLAAAFVSLAIVHIVWATGTKAEGFAAVPTRPDGRPLFRPGPAVTVAVAVLLLLAAFIVLGDTGILAPIGPPVLYHIGTWVIGAVFLMRTIGDFRYVGLFKRERGSRFARLDTRIYTPLCGALAIGAFVVALAR
jgi:hypothetical protein